MESNFRERKEYKMVLQRQRERERERERGISRAWEMKISW